MSDNFAVFILTHGRPNNVITYRTLEKQGYTGPVYIIIDNEDDTADEYRRVYGDKVIMFDKLAISKTFDTGDNFDDRRTIVYARNACFGIAEGLGIDYFLQLDDDYNCFYHTFGSDLKYNRRHIKNLDRLFRLYIEYYKSTDILTLTMAQGGDFFGGKNSTNIKTLRTKRKAMNTFFCSTNRPIQFVGRINEDVNSYMISGNRGDVFLMLFNNSINQGTTQHRRGGMTDVYLSEGTYIKSFYTIMYAPSCVHIYEMALAHKRLHHKINYNCAVPHILDEKYRKGAPKNV